MCFLGLFVCLFVCLFVLFMRDTERGRDTEEKQAPSRKPDEGLDPGTPGSCPRPKAGAKPLNHPGIPTNFYFRKCGLSI